MNKPDTSSQHADKLRAAGLRATGSRMAILAALERDRRHPTAEMLFEELRRTHPSISLSTVYATLETFLGKGLIRRVSSPNGKLRVDGTTPDHDHAICTRCSTVFDVQSDLVERPQVPMELPTGLKVVNLRIEYEVVCPNCEQALDKAY